MINEEQEFKVMEEDLIGSPVEQEECVNSIAHDLNASLRSIVEFSRLLKTEHELALNDEGKLYLSFIVNNGIKLQAMVAGLLECARVNLKEKPFIWKNGNDLLEECLSTLRHKIDATRTIVEVAPLPDIFCDVDQIKKLFLILLDNAMKFQTPGHSPNIKVMVEPGPEGLAFVVRDNGIGIDQKNARRVFIPFNRLHGDDDFPGVGLNLTLAERIVKRHGGRIWVDTSSEQGVAVKFTVHKTSKDKNRTLPSIQKIRILLVDDSESDALFVERILAGISGTHYIVHKVKTLEDALVALDKYDFRVVLLDYFLPGVTQFDGLFSIRNAAPKTPVIFLTSNKDEETALSALDRGAQDYLFKDDLNDQNLDRAIRYAVQRFHSKKKL